MSMHVTNNTIESESAPTYSRSYLQKKAIEYRREGI